MVRLMAGATEGAALADDAGSLIMFAQETMFQARSFGGMKGRGKHDGDKIGLQMKSVPDWDDVTV
ncbi:hypothetical protein [Paracoccus sp. SM22M-07]|uniref:hypothetical protein n=1 Tax=Paracoccus sp. SM22M-07 TaxID=1520813 RepID=UPI0011146F30|nr:hypothetical protein [Paracoccus sp. SM22M-07]